MPGAKTNDQNVDPIRGTLRALQVSAMIRLLHEAREIRAANDVTSPGPHLVEGVAHLLGADAGGAIIDEDFGAGRAGRVTHAWLTGFRLDGAKPTSFAAAHGPIANPGVRIIERWIDGARPGEVRGLLRAGPDARAWSDAPYVQEYLRPAGLSDAVFAAQAGGQRGVVRGLAFYRGRARKRFDEADRALLAVFATHAAPLLAPPRVEPRLSRRERATLESLVAGASEKEIAAQLGISRHTVHDYAKRIYRAFGVRSRGELLARVLSARGG